MEAHLHLNVLVAAQFCGTQIVGVVEEELNDLLENVGDEDNAHNDKIMQIGG